MSTVGVLASLQHNNLHRQHRSARERWAEGGEGADQTDIIDGVTVEMKYEGSNRRTDYRTVLLDGHHFARESETIPFSIFENIRVGYSVFIELRRQPAIEFLTEAGIPASAYELEDEWYPPEEGECQVILHTRELETVIQVWKAWKPKYHDHGKKET